MAQRHSEQETMRECFLVCHPVDRAVISRFPLDYVPKAVVAAASLDEVFAATNESDTDACGGPLVIPLAGDWFRSTLTGDIVIEGSGRAFLCDNIGWSEVHGPCSVLPFWWFSHELLVRLVALHINHRNGGA